MTGPTHCCTTHATPFYVLVAFFSLVGCHNNCFASQQDAAEVIGYLGERLPFLRGIRMVTEYECSKCNFRKPEEDQRVAYVPICVSASMLQCCVCVVVCARVFACACACVPCSCVRMSVCVCSGVSVCGPRRPTRVVMAPMNCGRDLSTVHGRCACEHNESGFFRYLFAGWLLLSWHVS